MQVIALKELNLLPEAEHEKKYWRCFLNRIIALWAIIFLFSGLFVVFSEMTINLLDASLLELQEQAEGTRYQKTQAYAQYLKQDKEVKALIEQYIDNFGNELSVEEMILLGELLPKSLYLTELFVDNQTHHIQLSGAGGKKEDLSKYILSLYETELFETVAIVRLEERDGTLTVFQLKIKMGGEKY